MAIEISCKICGHNNCEILRPISPMFSFIYGYDIVRYKCSKCGVIFGPIDFLFMHHDDLMGKYFDLYNSGYREHDSTSVELDILFQFIKPKVGLNYLNWGSGYSRSSVEAKKYNIDLFDYDPGVPGKCVSDIAVRTYSGIISNNWIEHSQDPVADLDCQRSLLSEGGVIAHKTPCYEYCDRAVPSSPFHLFFFVGNSLQVIAEKCGMIVELFGDVAIFKKIGESLI